MLFKQNHYIIKLMASPLLPIIPKKTFLLFVSDSYSSQ